MKFEGVGRNRDDSRRIVKETIDAIPLKGIIYTKDALAANGCVISHEQSQFHHKNASCRLLGIHDMTVSMAVNCVHHQAALAKKATILALGDIASDMVRMAHAHQISTFTRKYEDALDHFATHCVVRREVLVGSRITCSPSCFSSNGQHALYLKQFWTLNA